MRRRTTRTALGLPDRARTLAIKRITRAVLTQGAAENPPTGDERPKTRGECQGHARPCPWVACRHHLYLDINPETGSIKLNFPTLEPWELAETCSLDVADRDGSTLEDVGLIMNITRERVRQIEMIGLRVLKATSSVVVDESSLEGFAHPES